MFLSVFVLRCFSFLLERDKSDVLQLFIESCRWHKVCAVVYNLTFVKSPHCALTRIHATHHNLFSYRFSVVVIVSVVLDAYGSLLMMAWLWQVWFIRQQVCLPPIAKALLRLYSPPVTLEHLVVLVQVT